jgi:hypothetical protein
MPRLIKSKSTAKKREKVGPHQAYDFFDSMALFYFEFIKAAIESRNRHVRIVRFCSMRTIIQKEKR